MALSVLCTYSKMLLQEHFDVPRDLAVQLGDHVVLSTRRGTEIGRVGSLPGQLELRRDQSIAGKILRKATPEERAALRDRRTEFRTPQSVKEARALVAELGVPMRIEEVEETLDHSKYIFYFTADGRVDFRDLVRKMATHFGRRIELRQVGARDVARLAGDVDSCGEELCCKSFLIDFVPVSMKMAKNQGLSLDKSKVSGICGRLKCCLKYEDDLYSELRKTVPNQGQPVTVEGQEGWAFAVDILNQIVTVDLAGTRTEFPLEDVVFEKMSEKAVRTWHRQRREELERMREERKNKREERKKGGAATSQRRERAGDAQTQKTSGEQADGASQEAKEKSASNKEGGDDKPRRKRRRGRRRGAGRSGGRREGDGAQAASDNGGAKGKGSVGKANNDAE